MTECLADPLTNSPNSKLISLYRYWGETKAGLLITGNVMVDKRYLEAPGNVAIENENDLATLSEWAKQSQSNGSSAVVQISHPGRQCPISISNCPLSPSANPAVKAALPLFRPSRELTKAEILEIIARFARTASIVHKAGFAGVQVHGAHGYLISQFLSPLTNRRTDEYGGTAEKRRRFLSDVIKAVRAEVGPKFIIGVKINSADFQKGGFTNDESFDVVRMLAGLGVDFIEISGGNYENPKLLSSVKESTKQREAFFMAFVEEFRKVASTIKGMPPLMLTGGFRSAEGMDYALTSGLVDIVGIARPFATEPELVSQFLRPESLAAALKFKSPALGFSFLPNLNAGIENFWHQEQMVLIASGRKPNFNVGYLKLLTVKTFSTYVWNMRRNPPSNLVKFIVALLVTAIGVVAASLSRSRAF
jgi:2,4-dienoyl-CoA reductase-like NADH-dependent reductase (Old Yellow Enzyme family)